jgi:hypothetical protein
MTEPCAECPFTNRMKKGFTLNRLNQFASGSFPCHKTASDNDGKFEANNKSVHCAGALIYLEKRNSPNQMMRIAKRLGMYDHTKLKMDSDVR